MNKGYTIMYLMIFVFGTLIIQYICLSTYFSDTENNEVGLYYEILELIPIFYLVTGLLRRCPVCGKRFRSVTGKIYCSKECREEA